MLAGCETFDVKKNVHTVQVSWYAVGNVKQVCDDLFKAHGIKTIFMVQGCAVWKEDFSQCTIITSTNTSTHILGHELRHCFEGNFHP